MPYQSDKRLSEVLPSLDPSLDADLKAQAQTYVCSDCKTADPDPYVGMIDRSMAFYCPRCRMEKLTTPVVHDDLCVFTSRPLEGFSKIGMTNTFWLSFCDAGLPKGQQFLGACLVEGDDLVEATIKARELGINPGGEILGVIADPATVGLIRAHWKNRLLSKEECESMDREILAAQDLSGVPIPSAPEEHFLCKAHNPRR